MSNSGRESQYTSKVFKYKREKANELRNTKTIMRKK